MNGMDKASGKPLADFSHLQQSIMDILSTPIGLDQCGVIMDQGCFNGWTRL